MPRLTKIPAEADAIYLQIPELVNGGQSYGFAINFAGSNVVYRIALTENTPHGWKLHNHHFTLEALLVKNPAEAFLCIFDAKGGSEFLIRQKLDIDRNVLANVQDHIGAYWTVPPYEKPQTLAIFTHVYNEKIMLRLWFDYYGRFVPRENLYVINHGSDPDQIDAFRGMANVVDLPRGKLCHYNLAKFCGYFQRFLLTQYQLVMHIDCDELILYEGAENEMLPYLLRLSDNIAVKPQHAYEIFHDLRTEPPLDFTQKISLQRNHMVQNSLFCKPVVSSARTTWLPGYHTCEEDSVVAEQLWLIHLRNIDFDHVNHRARVWSGLVQTENDKGLYDNSFTLPDEIKAEFIAHLESERRIDMPAWMKGRF